MGSHGPLFQELRLRGWDAGAPCSREPLLGSERAQAVGVRGRAGGHGSRAAARGQKGPRQGQHQPHGTAQPHLCLEAWGLGLTGAQSGDEVYRKVTGKFIHVEHECVPV